MAEYRGRINVIVTPTLDWRDSEGQTCCRCNDTQYILHPGDLIVIPAHVSAQLQPRCGPARSYHMLYIDTDYPLAEQVIRDSTLFALT